jgi:hypothetical protein
MKTQMGQACSPVFTYGCDAGAFQGSAVNLKGWITAAGEFKPRQVRVRDWAVANSECDVGDSHRFDVLCASVWVLLSLGKKVRRVETGDICTEKYSVLSARQSICVDCAALCACLEKQMCDMVLDCFY